MNKNIQKLLCLILVLIVVISGFPQFNTIFAEEGELGRGTGTETSGEEAEATDSGENREAGGDFGVKSSPGVPAASPMGGGSTTRGGTSAQWCDNNPNPPTGYDNAVIQSTVTLDYNKLSSTTPTISGMSTFQVQGTSIRLNQGSSGSGFWMDLTTNHEYTFTDTITITYPGAAILPDETAADVVITISDITLYTDESITTVGGGGPTTTINMKNTIFDYGSGPSIRAFMLTSNQALYPYGLVETVNIKVDGAPAGSTFVFTAGGIDSTGYSAIKNASTHGDFKEDITIVSGSAGEYVGTGTERIYLADAAAGITFTATSSGTKADDNSMSVMAKGATAARKLTYTSSSGTGGSISPSGSITVPEAKVQTYTLTPQTSKGRYNLIDTFEVIVDGVSVDPATVGTLTPSATTDSQGNPASYTYTLKSCMDGDVEINVTWKEAPRPTHDECNDCKNPTPCNNCYDVNQGGEPDGYTKVVDGVYRGGDAASSLYTSGLVTFDDDRNTFATSLPYGRIYVDTSMMTFDGGLAYDSPDATPATIDIPSGSPFMLYKNGLSGTTRYGITGSSGTSGRSAAVGATQIAYVGGLTSYLSGVGYAESPDYTKLANGDAVGTDDATIAANKAKHSNLATAVEYYDSNSNVVAKRSVEDGQNIIKPVGVDYLYQIKYPDAAILPDGTRGDVFLTVTQLVMESTTDIKDAATGTEQPIIIQSANQFKVYMTGTKNGTAMIPQGLGTGSSDSNRRQIAVGAAIDWNVQIRDKSGNVISGELAYASKDLDLPSMQTIWGRQGYNPTTGDNPAVDYSEGMAVNSGALSFAVVPEYNHTQATTRDTGWVWNGVSPLIVKKTGTTNTADGVRFAGDTLFNVRKADGTLNPALGFYNNNITTKAAKETVISDGTWYDKQRIYNRPDNATYDTGFATLLNSAGSDLTWYGSGMVGDGVGLGQQTIDTFIFDNDAFTYLLLSHGTGGGVHMEAYRQGNNCEPYFIESLATMGTDSDGVINIVPEDGYRVKQIYFDDLKIEIDENGQMEINGSPVAFGVEQTAPSLLDDYGRPLTYTVKRESDGSYSIKVTNIKRGLKVHADFSADYYFQKVWEGGAANNEANIPDELHITAVPYVATPDSVTLDGKEYQIRRALDIATGVVSTVYTEVLAGGTAGASYTVKTDTTYQYSDKYPQAKYPQVIIGSKAYVIMENDLYEAVMDGSGTVTGIVDRSQPTATVTVKFERFEDTAYVQRKDFIVKKSYANDTSNLNVIKEVKNGNVIWKIKYPEEGIASFGWGALPIEVEDVTHAPLLDETKTGHDKPETHVERIYWFATEDIEQLIKATPGEGKWMMKEYDNVYENDAAWMSGIASYTNNGHLAYKDVTLWYNLATKDYNDLSAAAVMESMENIELAFMSPISEAVSRKDGTGYYTGWGGKIINRIIETKIRAYKVWQGDEDRSAQEKEKLRSDFKITIKREYKYNQKEESEAVASGKKSITFPAGSDMKSIMDALAKDPGTGTALPIKAFKRGVEPLLVDKTEATNAPLYVPGRHVKLTEGTGDAAAVMYIWYDATDGAINYWTDADDEFVFLNPDCAGMFYDMPDLKDIPGLATVNTSKVTNMRGMFRSSNLNAGSLTTLDYLRNWDVENVQTFENMFDGQTSLSNIYGVIDWNVSGAYNAATGSDKSIYFRDMFKNVDSTLTGANPSTIPFIYYPHLVMKSDGDLMFTNMDETTASNVENNLVFDYDAPAGNNIGTMDMSNPGRWHWDLDRLLLHSDESKWKYSIYENEMDNYVNLDGAVGDANAVRMVKNPNDGYLEYTLVNNLGLSNLTIEKTVQGNLGSRDQYFKFTIELEPTVLTEADAGHVLILDRSGHDIKTSTNNSTNKAYYTYTDGTAIADANKRDDLPETGDKVYQVVTGGLTEEIARRNVWTHEDARYVYEVFDDPQKTNGWYKYVYNIGDNRWMKESDRPVTAPPDEATTEKYSNLKFGDIADLPENNRTNNDGKAMIVVYLQAGEKLVIKDIRLGTKYKITEDDPAGYETWIVNGNGETIVAGPAGRVTEGTTGKDLEESASGKLLKVKNSDSYESPENFYADYTGDFSRLKRYSLDSEGNFVEDYSPNGTYYRVIDAGLNLANATAVDAEGNPVGGNGVSYAEIKPEDRYESLTKKYRRDATRAYTNKMEGVIPTEVFFPWWAWIIILLPLVYLMYRVARAFDTRGAHSKKAIMKRIREEETCA